MLVSRLAGLEAKEVHTCRHWALIRAWELAGSREAKRDRDDPGIGCAEGCANLEGSGWLRDNRGPSPINEYF